MGYIELLTFKTLCRNIQMYNGDDIEPDIISKLLPDQFKSPAFDLVNGFIVFAEFFKNNTGRLSSLLITPSAQVTEFLKTLVDKGIYNERVGYGISEYIDLGELQNDFEYFKIFVDTCLEDKEHQRFRYSPIRIKKFEEYINKKYVNWRKEHMCETRRNCCIQSEVSHIPSTLLPLGEQD